MENYVNGQILELTVAALLLKAGQEVALPFGTQKDWDLLAKPSDGPWEEIQVRTAEYRDRPQRHSANGRQHGREKGHRVKIRCANRKLAPSVKWIFAGAPETGQIWRIEHSKVFGQYWHNLNSSELWNGEV